MLQFVQLSSFTNLTAFQPLKCWTADGAVLSEQQQSISEYVARCTIWVGPPAIPSSDASKQTPGSFLDNITKLQETHSAVPKSQMADVFIVSELAAVVLSCAFIIDGSSGSTSTSSAGDTQRYFSFSMVFDMSLMNSLQATMYALSDRINRMARSFELILSQSSRSNLEDYVTACDNAVKRTVDYTCRLLQPRNTSLGDFSNTKFITDPENAEFWEFMTLCATSFLFTQRRAVVFSTEKSKEDQVNSIIRVLAALCTSEQLQYSAILIPDQQFIPDMYLQGLDHMPHADDLFECAHVLTLIDVDEKKVRRYLTEAFEEKKYERLHLEAQQLAERVRHKLATNQSQKPDLEETRSSTSSKSDSVSDSSFVSPSLMSYQLSAYNASSNLGGSTFGSPQLQAANETPDEVFFGGGHASIDEEKEITDMELPSDFIKQMILRVLQAPPFLRQAVLQQGLRVLMRWSLFVISSLPSKLEGEDGLRNKNLKMIQNDLGIANESDFNLFLHIADSCRPGFYTSILNNPKAVGKLVLDLFESF